MADAANTFDAFSADAQKAMTESVEKAQKSMTEMAAFSQDTMDALLKSQTVAAKAIEEFNAEVIAYSKKSMEESVAHAKDLSGAQTVAEFIEKQTGFAKHAFDSMMKQSAKMNELMVSAAKASMEPLNARATAATDLMKGAA